MTREEISKAAEEWVKEFGVKGEYQDSLDVAQEVAFEAGAEFMKAHLAESPKE